MEASGSDNLELQALGLPHELSLEELLDREARDLLSECAGALGIALSIYDRSGKLLIASAPTMGRPPPVVKTPEARPEGAIRLGNTELGRWVLGPVPRRWRAHVAELGAQMALLVDGLVRQAAMRMVASRALTEKNVRLKQAVERLEQADRAKSNFFATVSHELRTPLTSVIGYSEMLLEGLAGALNPEQREYMRTVMEKGDQLLRIINGILDISRMEAGQMQFERVSFDVGEVIEVALATVTPHARRKQLALSKIVAKGLPPVLGDRDRSRQVLINLLNNAIKFTPEAGSVIVAASPGAKCVRIEVRDSGIGVAPEYHQRIFEPFFQVDNSSTREYGGTGLGLNIVKRFVEAQGGAVGIESEAGRGATFFFTLPVASDGARP